MKRRRGRRSGVRRRNTTQRDLHFEANHHPPLPSSPLPSKQNSPPPFPFSILGIFGRHRGPPPPELRKKNGPGHKRGEGGGIEERATGRTRLELFLARLKKHINSLFPLLLGWAWTSGGSSLGTDFFPLQPTPLLG